MNLERARFEANVVSKAARLKTLGYTIEPDPCGPGWWRVTRPCGTIAYCVQTSEPGCCSCPLFATKRLCHHLLACRQEEETRWLSALCEEYEERISAAECETWGIDPIEEGNWPIFLGGAR